MNNPNRPGVVTCSECNKDVPDALLCVYCGSRLKGKVVIPPLKNRERQILEGMLSLGGISTVSDIHSNIGGSKEYIRVILMELARYGLVDKPSRGRYEVSKLGESALVIRKDIKIDEPTKRVATILIEKPEILKKSVMIRIFKRAGGERLGKNGSVALALALEQIGTEIAQDAVAIANNNNRKIVRVEDMEQAIRMMVPRLPEEVKT